MKKTICTTFKSILDAIHHENITSKLELEANPKLYANFWIAAKDFVHFATLSKTSGQSPEGSILAGNIYKIDRQISLGFHTREDIESICLLRIIDKLDLILKEPIEKQYNYCYTLVNHCVIDCYRKIPKYHYNMVSIDAPIRSVTDPAETRCRVADLIEDNTYNAEEAFLAHEAIKEAILQDIKILSKHPEEVMARLGCTILNMKPGELAERIVKEGTINIFNTIIKAIADDKINNLTHEDLLEAIANCRISNESIKASTNDSSIISKEISRLVYRAKDRLHK